MKIGIPTEVRPGETRVAATPETVKKYCAGGQNTVFVQAGAGAGANFPDADYAAAGATVVADAASVYGQCELVLKVRSPLPEEVSAMKSGTVLIGLLAPYDTAGIEALSSQGLTAFAMELLPRTSRAQSMDVLSSQANIAGYKAAASCRC
jgi:NAD(P) transhydrogenase subunit alpha